MRLNIYVWKTKFTSYKQYFLVAPSRKMQRRLMQTKVCYKLSLSSLIEHLREENRTKTLITKQLTKIKATVNPTNTLVTYNKNSTDKTTQNSDNVIDKTIQNNNKEPFKNKNKTKIKYKQKFS